METSNIPKFNFPELEIATLKDKILEYLFNHPNQPTVSLTLYDLLKPNDVTIATYNCYLDEMCSLDEIEIRKMSGDRNLLFITDKGKMRLQNGGYSQEAKEKLNDRFKLLLEEEKRQDKLDLELINLRESIMHYRSTRKISIWALVIGILSFVASVLFKFL